LSFFSKPEVTRTGSYNKTSQPVKAHAPHSPKVFGGSGGSVVPPSAARKFASDDLAVFKQVLLDGFRQELGVIKNEIIASIHTELATLAQ
jgi:hypothetical protein